MDWIDLSSQGQTVLTIIGVLVGFFFAYRIGKNKYNDDTIKGYEAAVRERDLRLNDADKTLVRVKEEHVRFVTDLKNGYDEKIRLLEKQVAGLEGKARVLEGVVTGKANFDELKKLIIDHDESTDKAIARFATGVKQISEKLDLITKDRKKEDGTS